MIVNCTPHTVLLLPDAGTPRTFPASGVCPRVTVDEAVVSTFDGVDIVCNKYGEVKDLPAPKEGVIYIVSSLVMTACPDRTDLVCPARLVRDTEGRIVGCKALARLK